MSIVAMTLDSLLRSESSGGPLAVGRLLYHSIGERSTLAVIADEFHENAAAHWLLVNGFDRHTYLVLRRVDDPEDVGERRIRQVARLRDASTVDLLVDPDPAVAEAVMVSGTPVLLALHPLYARPEFLPGYRSSATPWSSLTGEIDRQREIRANDKRQELELV